MPIFMFNVCLFITFLIFLLNISLKSLKFYFLTIFTLSFIHRNALDPSLGISKVEKKE